MLITEGAVDVKDVGLLFNFFPSSQAPEIA